MYARRVGDRKLTFCVSGYRWNCSLVMMDIETEGLWSHILGRAMQGPLEGEVLEPIPSVMTDWKTWKATHPETTVAMLSRTAREFLRAPSRFLIGIAEGGEAKAWPFDRLREQPVVNDRFAGRPLLVAFDPQSRTASLYDRRIEGRELTFRRDEGKLVDDRTDSEWDSVTGRAIGGPPEGEHLEPVPGVVSFRAAWEAFHPQTAWWSASDRSNEPPGSDHRP